MKTRVSLLALSTLCMFFAAPVMAADAVMSPAPSPTPDLHIYSDRAMHFVAPEKFILAARRVLTKRDLAGASNPLVVAVWVKNPGQEDQEAIMLSMEGYSGNLDGFFLNVENGLRDKINGVFIDQKKLETLPNGMPAYWIRATYGHGFKTRQRYMWAWFDGARGVILAIDARAGEIGKREARADLHRVRATLYPSDE